MTVEGVVKRSIKDIKHKIANVKHTYFTHIGRLSLFFHTKRAVMAPNAVSDVEKSKSLKLVFLIGVSIMASAKRKKGMIIPI